MIVAPLAASETRHHELGRWKDSVKRDGPRLELDVYTFMTTAPNALNDGIIHKRMPVPLSDARDFETWRSGSAEYASALARSFEPSAMRIVQSDIDKEDLLGRASIEEQRLL